jgi:hypothetical protein
MEVRRPVGAADEHFLNRFNFVFIKKPIALSGLN